MSSGKKVAVVTGAAQGIGRAIAERFHKGGAALVLLDRNPAAFDGWVGELGSDVLTVACDVAKRADVEHARDEALSRFGRIDVLVNNAGIGKPYTKFEEITDEAWNQVVNVNLNGVFLCTQIFGSAMLDQGGAIVNISSQAGINPSAGKGAYGPTKAAMLLLTKQLAVEWGPRKVRINAICPGMIKTPWATAGGKPYDEQARANIIPAGRVGRPEDVANVTYFLASEEADYVNGESIHVAGGFNHTCLMQMTRIAQKQ